MSYAIGAIPLAATGEAAKSGPLGLAVILAFCVICYFLFKSMSKHLRKVREEFPVDPDEDASAAGPAVPDDPVGSAPGTAVETSESADADAAATEQETERPTAT